MTGTTDMRLAELERALEYDPAAAADVLQLRARELAQYHRAVLAVARPILRDLIALHAAVLMTATGDDELDANTLKAAIAMACDDPRLMQTLKTRVDRVRATVSREALRLRDLPARVVEASEPDSPN